MTLRDRIAEIDPDLLVADGFDEAVIGIASRCAMEPVVVYSRAKCIEILAREMSEEEAEEYFDFNVAGAYVGERTPMFLTRIEDE